MLPNFLIIGAEKAATTWLARCLAEHPSVYMPREKEIFFFSTRFDRGLGWYESHFQDRSGQALVGEATPVYLSHPQAPARIRSTLGEIDLVASLRHPVDRAYSAYWHNLRRGRLARDSDFFACFRADEHEIRTRGDYFSHLVRYLECFPRERLQVLVYEEIGDDGERALGQCLDFLGLDTFFTPRALHARLNEGGKDIRVFNRPAKAMRAKMRQAVLWSMRRRLIPRRLEQRVVTTAQQGFDRLAYGWGPRARSYEPLDHDLRAELFEVHYRGQVERLEQLLEMDLSRWYAVRTATRSPDAARRLPPAADG